MSCFSLRLSTLHSHFRHVRHDCFWQRFGYEAKNRRFPLIRVKSVRKFFVTRDVSSSCSLVSSLPALEIDVEDSSPRQVLGHEVDTYRSDSLENYDIKEDKERQRREKIGLANKYRVPWNKGKQHDEETRERIKQRTIEALKNPKVREKMSACRHPHSDQVKSKIGASQKRVWSERLKSKQSKTIHLWTKSIAEAAETGGVEEETLAWNSYEKIKEGTRQKRVRSKRLNSKRSKARLFHLWAKSIAEAAKTGGLEEETLAWNSYEKIKEELRQMQLNRDAQEVLKKIRTSEKRVRVKEKHMEIARKSKLREEKKKKKEEIAEEKRRFRRGIRDSKKRLRLKDRLNQIRQKISRNTEVSSLKSSVSPHDSVLEKMDLDLIKSEISRRSVSLADQIKAAKSKKAEFTTVDGPGPKP